MVDWSMIGDFVGWHWAWLTAGGSGVPEDAKRVCYTVEFNALGTCRPLDARI